MGWELQSIGVHIGSKIAEENKIYFTTNKYRVSTVQYLLSVLYENWVTLAPKSNEMKKMRWVFSIERA